MQLYQADKPLRLIMVSTADKDKVVSRLRKEIDSLRTENKRLLVAKERTDSAFSKVEEDIERLETSIFYLRQSIGIPQQRFEPFGFCQLGSSTPYNGRQLRGSGTSLAEYL